MGSLKVGNIKNQRHLKTSIEYIFNDTKTDNGRYIFGDSGFTPDEVYDAFVATKDLYNKNEGRQAYHFILTFPADENVSEEIAQEITERFMDKYFPENEYDWCAAVHNDKAHMHSHIIFNSVNRNNGYKYRYEKGDWEKHIQSIVDELCNEYGLKTIAYEFDDDGKKTKKERPKKHERGGSMHEKHNPEIKSKSDLIRQDIDRCINKSNDYQEFVHKMKQDGYEIREGKSEKYGDYISFKPYGFPKATRSFRLGDDYSLKRIKERISNNEIKKDMDPISDKDYTKIIKLSRIKPRTYRRWYAKHIYIARIWKNKKPFPGSYQYKKDIVYARKTLEEYNLLKKYKYKSIDDIMEHIKITNKEIHTLYSARKKCDKESEQYIELSNKASEKRTEIKVAKRLIERIESTKQHRDNLTRSKNKEKDR